MAKNFSFFGNSLNLHYTRESVFFREEIIFSLNEKNIGECLKISENL